MPRDYTEIARLATGRDDIAGQGRYAVVRGRGPWLGWRRCLYTVTLHASRADAEADAENFGRDGDVAEIVDLHRAPRDASL